MPLNAAGLDVSGSKNPKWRGGLIKKTCEVCASEYEVKPVHRASRFCSMRCVGISQRGKPRIPEEQRRQVEMSCEICAASYWVPTSHSARYHCCSKRCSHARRSQITKGSANPSWAGGVSRLPYPWNFKEISRSIIARDGARCQNPGCTGVDKRLTTHHVDYNKSNCAPSNLICLCSACNSKANFGRAKWAAFYQELLRARGFRLDAAS